MAKYRNSRIEAEQAQDLELENQEKEIQKVLEEVPARSVEEETWKKRYGDQQRYLNQLKAEHKAELEEIKSRLDTVAKGRLHAPKTNEDVENWIKEYPEFAGILEKIIETRVKDATSTTNKKLAEIEEKAKAVDAREAILELTRLHPDWDQLRNDQKFHSWLSQQSQKRQDAIYKSLDVEAADDVITRYKATVGKKKSQGDDDFNPVNAAKVVRKASVFEEPDQDAGEWEYSESQIKAMSAREFELNEDKIMQAHRKGKILLDLSGGAR